jgi:hypothetical protein
MRAGASNLTPLAFQFLSQAAKLQTEIQAIWRA